MIDKSPELSKKNIRLCEKQEIYKKELNNKSKQSKRVIDKYNIQLISILKKVFYF